jgi:hypothetical protein
MLTRSLGLGKRANVNAKSRKNGRTALHKVAQRYRAVVQLLLEEGVDACVVIGVGRTALHEAIVRLLLEKKKRPTSRPRLGLGGQRLARPATSFLIPHQLRASWSEDA